MPPVPAAGVPDSVAVPLPLSWKVTPVGKVPDSERLGAGYPEVVTVKLPAVPTVKVVEAAEVIAGAWSTVKVKAWVAFGLTPLLAVTVRL